MGKTVRVYEDGKWTEYEVVWDGGSLLPEYDSVSVTSQYCDRVREILRPERLDQRALKEGYRIAGKKRRRQKDDPE